MNELTKGLKLLLKKNVLKQLKLNKLNKSVVRVSQNIKN